MSEAKLQTLCNKYLKDEGYDYFHDERGSGRGKRHRAGLPDLIIWNWPMCFVELKTETGKVSLSQKMFMGKMLKHGHMVYVCNSFELFKQIIRQHYGQETT